MSQRHSQILTSQFTPSAHRSQELKHQIKTLKTLLEQAGVQLSFADEPHILTQEQALVARDLEKKLDGSGKSCDDFVKGLNSMCKKKKLFRKALLVSNLRKNGGNESLGLRNEIIEQESLFRILLKVTCLQNKVMDILLDEITNISSESSDDTSWLHMLLNPLRYLPYIKDAQSLTTRLLDVLEIATYPAQLEILDSIPEIIPDGQYSETAKQLCKLLDNNDELTGAVIDCLNALDLDSDMRSQVQDRILAKILSGSSLKIFPILLSFLMTDCKSQNMVQTLLKIRNALDSMMLSSDKSNERESCKILIFNKLQTFAVSSKIVSEAWLNMISIIKSHSDHRPVDYLILFMLHGTVQFKKRIIEAMFRKRVHTGLFKINQLEKVFEKYLTQQLLKDYFNSIVEIGCSLIRSSNDQINTEFASTLFKLLFGHESTERIYRREILENLVILTGASDKKTVGIVLKIISSFLAEKEKLQPHTILLMRLLEKLDTFELREVKQVFEILCSLTCGENADESMSGLRDEIHMIVRKQLYSTKRAIKHRGIISAIVMARHIAKTSRVEPGPTPDCYKTVSSLPAGPAREAGTLLELVSTCTASCPELTGLYYDQLALMLMQNNQLNTFLMTWLYETVTEGFGNVFTTEKLPERIRDIDMSMQYMLNDHGETDTHLGVNIAGLTLTNNPQIILLAPNFRLLRLLHYRLHDGHLFAIDALLGSAVIMPEVDLDDLESDQVKQVADCLFYCTNWFREVISGFVTQKEKCLRSKVVTRLQHMLEVQQKLQKCMESIPDHKLPVSYFDSTSELNKQASPSKIENKTKNPRKKFKSAAVVQDVDETANTTAAAATQAKKKKQVTKSASNAEHPISFREMDTDLVLLIKYPLKFPEDDSSEFLTQTATLTIEQLKFILKDFVSKVATLSQNKDTGLLHLHMVAPIEIITDGIVVLPLINFHLKVIIKKINNLLEKTNRKLDFPEMFTQEALDIKACFGLILEIFYLIFSWAGFQHSSNLEILKNLLKTMRTDKSQSLNSAHRLIAEFITRISELSDQCLELPHAVSLVKTMEALYSASTPNPEIQKKIVSVAKKLLSKRWYNHKGHLESGRSCNLNIDVLVKVYLSSASIKTISGLVGTLQGEADSLHTKEDCLNMLATIDKQNFHVLYNGLCSALLNRVKTEVESLTNTQHLTLWNNTAVTMQGLMTIAKVQESKTNLVCFLKKSIGVLKVFLSHGIPILEITLRSKPDDVVAIFKAMQTTTRFLHHLCCYSKLTKDSSLMAFVPKFRLTLETLVYRVKAALVANNCSAAFWMGNLRNRDLQGEDILSQSTITTDANEENDEEQLPDDDSDDDLTNVDNSSVTGDGSVSSEVFD